MRARGATGGADQPDPLRAFDRAAFFDVEPREVRIDGVQARAVVDDHRVAGEEQIACERNPPGVRRVDFVDEEVALAARLDQRIALDVEAAAYAGLTISDLGRRLGAPSRALVTPLATLVAAGELLATTEAEHAHYLHARAVAEFRGSLQRDAVFPFGRPLTL